MPNIDANQASAISRLFSSSVIKEMARTGKSPLLARLARESGLLDVLRPPNTVSDLFEAAFSILKKKAHRHEYVYKSALTNNVLLGTHNLQTASMITEFRSGQCKADLVIFNGTATVYEIKSERDTLSRLERQIAAYRDIFATVYVIAGENHIDDIMEQVPQDVGVMLLSPKNSITRVRKAISQPERTRPEAIFDSLRTAEAKRILTDFGITVPNVPNTVLNQYLRSLFVTLSPSQAHEGMVQTLRQTRTLMPLENLVKSLPSSLHAVALTTPIRKIDHNRLVSAVGCNLEIATGWA